MLNWSTPISELLQIKVPVLQGGMAWVSDGVLAAAVSKSGGLGIIAAGNAPADWVRNQIRYAKSQTDKPFGVNIMLMSPFAADVAKVVVEEGVKVVTTGAGSPGVYIPSWKEAGIKIIPVIPSSALAIRMERAGVDAIIAEGGESGGHVGEMTTMALVPQVVDAVKIPVIAAGGIADGRGMAAAFMLGAVGVQMGTRFLASNECTVHENYKNKVIEARDTDTAVTGRSTGHPVRILKNRLSRQFTTLESGGASVEELEALGAGRLKLAAEGDADWGSLMAGQSAGMVKCLCSVEEILNSTCSQARLLLKL